MGSVGTVSIHSVYRALAVVRDAQAAARGPVPYAKRQVRKRAHRVLARMLRRVL